MIEFSSIIVSYEIISHDDDDYNEITFSNHSVNRAGDLVFLFSVAFAMLEQLSDYIC